MTPLETHSEALEQLAVGDVVTPCETLKRRTMTAIAVLREPTREVADGQPFDLIAPEAEETLAVVLPLIEYGGEEGSRAVLAAFQLIADESGNDMHLQRSGVMLALHHLVWVSVAYCLRQGLLTELPALASITIPESYGVPESVFVAPRLRHADAFGGNADQTFESAVRWLSRLSLLEQLPLLQDERALQVSLAEADLIAALRMAQDDRDTYCHALGTGVEAQLRAHLDNPAGPESLAWIFRTTSDELPATLHRCYARLTPRRGGWHQPGMLFPGMDLVSGQR